MALRERKGGACKRTSFRFALGVTPTAMSSPTPAVSAAFRSAAEDPAAKAALTVFEGGAAIAES
jgi:hypothetical protein